MVFPRLELETESQQTDFEAPPLSNSSSTFSGLHAFTWTLCLSGTWRTFSESFSLIFLWDWNWVTRPVPSKIPIMSSEKDLTREFMTLKFENCPVAVYIGYMSALDILSLKRTKRHLRIRELFFFKNQPYQRNYWVKLVPGSVQLYSTEVCNAVLILWMVKDPAEI